MLTRLAVLSLALVLLSPSSARVDDGIRIRASGRGAPWVSFADGVSLGAAGGASADGRALGQPLALAAGDVDATDNVVGGGVVRGRNVISGNGTGVVITGPVAARNAVSGNHVGTDSTGTVAVGNGVGISLAAADNVIGGTTALARNLVSGNTGSGIYLSGADATRNAILGNFIGTDATGTAGLGNTQHGVRIDGGTGNTIGGTTPASRNVIGGNGSAGVYIAAGSSANTVSGNFIGTSVTGAAALRNDSGGVTITASSGNTIGGTEAGARNVVSGNGQQGIKLGEGASGNTIAGNLIGVTATGGAALSNNVGVRIESPGNTVGGSTAAAGNVISGNSNTGVRLAFLEATGNVIAGNFIGTTPDGTAARGNAGAGIGVAGAPGNTIGGVRGNVISGNGIGVEITGEAATGNTLTGNFIGTDGTGTIAIGNAGYGVTTLSPDTTIGGSTIAAPNIIAFNAGGGVGIGGTVTGNTIFGNSIFSNTGLGIDLGKNGVTANDPGDGDTGPNNKQNFPVMNGAVNGAGSGLTFTTITGALDSLPSTTFMVEWFVSPACHSSGRGEGKTFLTRSNLTTNSTGTKTFTLSVSPALTVGHVVTATATAGTNTSEFSPCRTVTAP